LKLIVSYKDKKYHLKWFHCKVISSGFALFQNNRWVKRANLLSSLVMSGFQVYVGSNDPTYFLAWSWVDFRFMSGKTTQPTF